MDDIIDYTGYTDNIDKQDSCQPYDPMGPNMSHFSIHKGPDYCDGDEPKEHCDHSLECWLVNHLMAGPFIDKIEHLMSGDIPVRV